MSDKTSAPQPPFPAPFPAHLPASLPDWLLDKALDVARAAADRAGRIMLDTRAASSVTISLKSAHNLVTSTDLAAEKAIIATIGAAFPEHAVLAEESAILDDPGSFARGPVWVIDPVDGTTNFAHGHLQVGVSIALVVDGVSRVGVVHSPFQQETFAAVEGRGATLNGKQIRTTDVAVLDDALVATGFPYARDHVDIVGRRLVRVLGRCRDVRRLGAASLDISWVACGRLDAFYEETLMPWDCCAAVLIAREAGARIGHFPYDHDGQRKTERFSGDLYSDNIVVAAPRVFEELSALLDLQAA